MKSALFLDRDGVVNLEKDGSYIFSVKEFVFYDNAPEALAQLSRQFDYLFIVTNQRGVGRGLMSEAALKEIHHYLVDAVEKAGGKIDAVYYATATDRNHPMRKPNNGMALQARKEFPDLAFARSVMAGNNLSDMQFGKSVGMKTIFLHTTQPAVALPHPLIDEQYSSLVAYAKQFKSKN